ncbi:MAG: hypothetical protein QM737_19015 [Ferruginibacter sp.]
MLSIKTKYCYKYILIVPTLLFCYVSAKAQYKITDTIYYSQFWKICEQPVASYYRAGILASFNDKWYYTGEVKDYKMDNTLIMEGKYNEDGIKDGEYKFYYPDGKLMAKGKYDNGMFAEKWTWYYPNGNEEAIMDFSQKQNQIEIVKFTDSAGNTTLDNGTGDFTWYSDPFEWEHYAYKFTGSYKDGKRSGTWHFEPYPKKEDDKRSSFRLKYNRLGQVMKDEYDYSKSIAMYTSMMFYINASKLRITESMKYDDLFNINADSTALSALAYYLIDHKPIEVDLRYKLFSVAYNTILKTLDHYKYKLHFTQDREINCKLEFTVGSKGLENINFSGTGLTADEMNYFIYILKKFKNVEMPGDEKVGQETNITIYILSIDFREIIPDGVHTTDTKELIFSFKPREKVEKYLHDNKDDIKKMSKEKMDSYYQDSSH